MSGSVLALVEASLVALSINAATAGSSTPMPTPSRKFSTRPGNSATACSIVCSTGARTDKAPSRQRLSMFSTAQPNSPMRIAPTMRPLPLSVWKARRTSPITARLPGSRRNAGRCRSSSASTSPASSMKISRISGSMPSLTGAEAGAGASTGAAGGGTAASGCTASINSAGAGTSAARKSRRAI